MGRKIWEKVRRIRRERSVKISNYLFSNWKIVKKETKQIEEIVGGTQDAKESLNLPSEDVDEDQNKVDQVSWVRSY